MPPTTPSDPGRPAGDADAGAHTVARNLAFALAIAGGTAIGAVTGIPAAGLAGTALAGLLGNAWTAELGDRRQRHLRGPQFAHPNHDLAKLVGAAIARALFDHAPEHPAHRKWLERLGKAAQQRYLEIASHPALAEIGTENLPALFQAAAGSGDAASTVLLDDVIAVEGRQRTAARHLVELIGAGTEEVADEAAMSVAEQAILHRLFPAIREMFKRDFENNGRAYAALAIDMTSQTLALLARVAGTQADALQRQRVYHEELHAMRDELVRLFENQRNDLEREQARSMSSLLADFSRMRDRFDEISHSLLLILRTQAVHSAEHTEMLRLLQEINERQKQQVAHNAVLALPAPAPALTDSEQGVLDQARWSEDALTRAAAALLQRDFAAVDRILRDESRDRRFLTGVTVERSSTDQAVRYYTLVGDRWLFADEFDRAVEPYEIALVLRPEDPMSRNNAAVARTFARLGSVAEHRRRAVEIHTGTLAITPSGSTDWAMTQSNLGNAWSAMPTGDRGENLDHAIAAYEAALTVYSRTDYPVEWAGTQNNLAAAWAALPTGDRAENLRRAIAACEAALTVHSRDAHPADWAGTQNNLGNALMAMPTGDRAENLRQAIAAYEAVLSVYTRSDYPAQWAGTQNNLGYAWRELPTGDPAENLRRAIDACEAALTVYTKEEHPARWATTQNNLGNAWRNLPTGDRGDNLRRAIDAYEAALTVFSRTEHPVEWAGTQTNLGNAWRSLPTGNRRENLHQAIAACTAALTVYTESAHPAQWAATQNYLGNAWRDMPTGNRGGNLRKAIAAYEAALTYYTKSARPFGWAMTHSNLASAWSEMPIGDRAENLRRAIASCEAALTVYTMAAHPLQWAGTQNNLGTAWSELSTGDRGDNLRRAIGAYEAALTIYTRERHPVDWAMTQNNLGTAWNELPTRDRMESLRRSITAYEAALTVRTRSAHPLAWAVTQSNLSNSLAAMAELPGEDACALLVRAVACVKGSLLVLTAEAFPSHHRQMAKALRSHHATYETMGCSRTLAFDDIEPAS
jgi:tetratricopeptide (TPR) repeat protein